MVDPNYEYEIQPNREGLIQTYFDGIPKYATELSIDTEFTLKVKEAHPISPQEAGLNYQHGVHRAQLYRVQFDVAGNLDIDMESFINNAIATNSQLTDLISSSSGDPHTANVDFFVKDMFGSDQHNERRGYETLARLGIPTLCCVYPPANDLVFNERKNLGNTPTEVTITIIKNDLQSLNEMSSPMLFETNPDTTDQRSIFEQTMDHLAMMHSNYFVHGDADRRGFACKEGEVYVLDPEASVDFRRVLEDPDPSIARIFLKKQSLQLERYRHIYSLDKQSPLEEFKKLYALAIYNDLSKMVNSVSSYAHSTDEINSDLAQKNIHQAFSQYITRMEASELGQQILKTQFRKKTEGEEMNLKDQIEDLLKKI